MFREQSELLKYLFVIFDFCVSFLAYGLAFLIRFVVMDTGGEALVAIDLEQYMVFGLILSFNQVVTFLVIDLYQARRIESLGQEWFAITGGVFLNLMVSLSILFFLTFGQLSRYVVALYGLVAVVLFILTHSGVRTVLRTFRSKGKNIRTAILIGSGTTAVKFLDVISRNPYFGLHILGEVSDGFPALPKVEHLGSIDQLEAVMERTRPNLVISALDDASGTTMSRIMEVADMYGALLKVIPGFARVMGRRSRVEMFDGTPVVSVRPIPSREGLNRIAKRVFDITFSLLFVAFFSWLYLLIALAIKVTSRGPVFFKQDRVGLDGRVFSMLKFRSMKVQAIKASDTIWTTKDDPRVTVVGRFIRRTSLDEIPQFFNVLGGQMSVVGPRPERPYYVEQFKTKYRFFMRRHAVKAGVTGWAQINGLRGDTSIEERVAADIYYIENWSLWLDFQIVLLTPFKGILSKDAY